MPGPRSKPKVRASGQPLASCNIDLGQIPAGEDGWHTERTLLEGLISGVCNISLAEAQRAIDEHDGTAIRSAARAEQVRLGEAPESVKPTMDPATAFATGRIHASSRPSWESAYRSDPAGVGETLATLAPVLDVTGTTRSAMSASEQLDELDDAVFGPGHSEASRQRQRQREDEAVLARHYEILAEEQASAASGLSDAEFDHLFPPRPKDS
jgi:hypothetical protein